MTQRFLFSLSLSFVAHPKFFKENTIEAGELFGPK